MSSPLETVTSGETAIFRGSEDDPGDEDEEELVTQRVWNYLN